MKLPFPPFLFPHGCYPREARRSARNGPTSFGRPKYFPTGAFTLIELLAVLGIALLLCALLVPVLQRAKKSADLARCTANLRSLAGLTTCYVNDNDGTYMPSGWMNGDHWYDRLKPYLDVPANDYVGHRPGPTRSLRCPTVQAAFALKCSNATVVQGFPNYGMNVFVGPNKSTTPLVKVFSVRRPTTTILFMDGGFNSSTPIAGVQPADPSAFQDYHMGGNNILFADGHVQLWQNSKSLTLAPYKVGGTEDAWSP